ncbi:MAG: HAMP domain-containing histidine kinase [Spirulina sp. SIO3F2]|nr:HAMP domain-containing histidine kinase [Spirulina sp. SIO3F2]
MQRLSLLGQRLGLRSLQMQLTVGVTAMAALGLGGVALGLGLYLDHVIVVSHKKQVQNLAQRFGETVEIYSDMTTPNMALEKAVVHLSTGDTSIWVVQEGEIVARSEALTMGSQKDVLLIAAREELAPYPKVYDFNNGYWIMCGTPLIINKMDWGQLNIAHDITGAQGMLYRLLWTLGGASVFSLGLMCVAIAIYIRQALKPLKTFGYLTDQLSAEQLGQDIITLDHAPSELKTLENAFNRMLHRFHESWEHQRQFVGHVSHELRTPLTIVSGYLQSTLRRGSNLSDPQREALTVASSEARRTVQLLEDLLELARADSGHLHFRQEAVVLNDFLWEVVEMSRQYSQGEIKVSTPQTVVVAQIDRDRLKQVLLNLIDNAVKYAGVEEPIQITLSSEAGQAQLQVCDRGPGIPLTQQQRIFERFYRLDESRCRSGGTGLGLSIVKTLVEGMGGQITVRSTLGEGSTFIVTLPLGKA